VNIKILTIGTRGDVQPFIALGVQLVQAGHRVTICTSEAFKQLILEQGLHFFPVRADFLELTQSAEGKKLMSGNPLTIVKQWKLLIYPMMVRMLEDMWAASEDAEVLIYHPKAFGGYDIAEKLNIPVFLAHPVPILMPTSRFTNPVLPFSLNNGLLNRFSYTINRLLLGSFMNVINQWRRSTLGLPKKRSVWTNDLQLNGRDIPVLYGCSPSVIPYDPEWKDRVHMSGFWFLDEQESWQPPEQLLQFLDSKPQPIAVSFSSMPLKAPELIRKRLVEALRRSGQRAILLTGWSGIENQSSDDCILCLREAPHSWLFPRTAGVIHHGGAGTTAAVLRAGKPMSVCPFTADQPFWARRMYDLGVAAKPLVEKNMTVEALEQRILELTSNENLAMKSQQIAQAIHGENGAGSAAGYIQSKLME
jgi:sterol 3beta-glucosyltransferase